MKIRKEAVIVFFIILMAFYGLSLKINKSFVGLHDWNGAYYGNIVRNYLRLGLIETKLGQVINVNGKNLQFSNHYTPELALYFTFSSRLFGLSEITLRYSIVFSSLLMLVFIYKIGALFNKKIGLISALFISLTPLYLYYGKLPDHDPLVVSLSTATVYYFLTKRKKRFVVLYIISLLESWPAFFLCPGFFLISLLSRKVKRRFISKKIIIMIPVCLLILAFSYSSFLAGNLSSLISVFKFRANISDNSLYSFSFKEFVTQIARYHMIYYTRIMLIFSFFGILLVILNRKKYQILIYPLSIFFLYALSFLIIFSNLYWIHDYKIIHLLPFISITSGFLLWKISAWLKPYLPRTAIYILLLIVMTLVFNERKAYFLTILRSANAEEAHEIGMYLNVHSNPQNEIVILPEVFGRAQDVFVAFYSDRQVSYQSDLKAVFKFQPRLIILTSDFDKQQISKNNFAKYKLIKRGDFQVYENNNFN